MNKMRGIQIYLDRQEALLLLEALVEQPFKQVFEIIGKINQRLPAFDTAIEPQGFTFQQAELSVCVKALGDLPYSRVCTLIARIHQQLLAQHTSADEQEYVMEQEDDQR